MRENKKNQTRFIAACDKCRGAAVSTNEAEKIIKSVKSMRQSFAFVHSLKSNIKLFPIQPTNFHARMKKNIRNKSLFFGATILGAILFAGASASAANILQTAQESSPSDWNAAIWGSGPSAPTSANTYETPSGFQVRTTNSATSDNFLGNQLQIDAGGILYLKHNNGVQAVNLVLNGGQIVYHGGPGGSNAPIGG